MNTINKINRDKHTVFIFLAFSSVNLDSLLCLCLLFFLACVAVVNVAVLFLFYF